MVSSSANHLDDALFEHVNQIINHIVTAAKSADNAPVEATHLVRKGLKKCRALVKLTRHLHAQSDYDHVNHSLRDAGKSLSDLRDAHVRDELFNSLMLDRYFDAEISVLKHCKILNQDLIESLENSVIQTENQFTGLIRFFRNEKHITAYFRSKPVTIKHLSDGLARSFKKSENAYQQIDQKKSETLHEWRKRLKDVQYQLEAVSSIIESSPDNDALNLTVEINDLLGTDHDYFMLMEWMETQKRPIPFDHAESLLEKLSEKRHALQSSAVQLANSLYSNNYHEISFFVIDG